MAQSTDFEQQRQNLIARNRARLQSLGLSDAAEQLTAATKPRTKPKPKRVKAKTPQAPTRHSARTAGEAPLELNDEEAQLAKMYVDGECPKCGKALEMGIKQHFQRCKGLSQRKIRVLGLDADVLPGEDDSDDSDEDEAEQPITKLPKPSKEAMAEKLKALELSGLVDFSAEHAKFAVVGSTGNRYSVTLSDSKRACQCVDHRVRRHDCKHIKLVLQQLGCGGKPAEWRQAVEKQLDAAAAAEANGDTSAAAAAAAAAAEPPETDAAVAADDETDEDPWADKQTAARKESRKRQPKNLPAGSGEAKPKRQRKSAASPDDKAAKTAVPSPDRLGGRRMPARLRR